MSLKRVKSLADGRIYTAKQAKANGLIDEISTRDEAIAAMIQENGLKDCECIILSYTPKFSFSNWMMGIANNISKNAENEYDQVLNLMGENNRFSISYISHERS